MIRKIIVIIFIMSGTVIASGCSSKTELENRDFCMAIGIDMFENEFLISYAFPDLGEITGQEGKAKEHLYNVKTKSLYESELMYAYTSNKQIDFSHLKVMIISENVAYDSEKMKELLRYLEDSSKYSKNTLVFVTKESAKSIVELQGNVEGSIGNYLNELYINNIKNNNKESASLGDLINNMNNTEEIMGMPIVEIENRLPVIKGAGIFKNNTLLDYVNNEQYTYLLMAKGDGRGNSIVIDNDCTIKLENIKRTYSIAKINEKPYLLLEIKGSAIVINRTVYKEKSKEELNNEINQVLSNNVKQTLQDIINMSEGDFINSYKLTGVKNRGLWLSYRGNERGFYNDLTLKVPVDLDIR